MPFSVPVSSPVADSRYVNGLLWGAHWQDEATTGPTRLGLYVVGAGDEAETFEYGFRGARGRTNAAEEAAFRLAAEFVSDVCLIEFVDVNSQAEADVLVAAVSRWDPGGRGLGISQPPGESDRGVGLMSRANYATTSLLSLEQGGYDFVTAIHELGHALGLKHPHDRGGSVFPKFPGVRFPFDDYGAADLNQGIWTTMSYNDGFETRDGEDFQPRLGWQGTLMAFDIAALQHLYGANPSHRGGDDSYVLPPADVRGETFYACLWDTGGTDRIVAGGARDAVIDLRAATLVPQEGGGGWLSAHEGVEGGLTIAAGVVIEEGVGGSGDDALTGNAASNVLSGRGGKDAVLGGDGDDRLEGGAGRDRLEGGAGADRFVFAALSHSREAAPDRVRDFAPGADLLDLGDVSAALGGLTFIGSDAFSGAAGEVRAVRDGGATSVLVDGDGDRAAEMRIELAGRHHLTDADFVF